MNDQYNNKQFGHLLLVYAIEQIFQINFEFEFSFQQTLDNRNSLPATSNQTTTYTRQFETDRSVKNGIPDNFNTQMQNEHAWAIDRKRAGAK